MLQKVLTILIFALSGQIAVLAQAPPQDGTFVKICDMYGSSDSGGQAWQKDDSCPLPSGFRLDKSYHQSAFNCCGGGATSNIGLADIPAGMHLDVSGGYYWSVTRPIELFRLDEDGPPKRIFRLHTYCGPAGRPGPGCNVKVAVYAKKLE